MSRATTNHPESATVPMREVAQKLNCGINAAYAAAHKEELPVIWINGHPKVLRKPFEKMLAGD